MVLMEIGRRFAAAGSIDRAGDIFHLTLAEIRTDLAVSTASRRAQIAERKAELARWATVTPPETLGAPPPDTPPPAAPVTAPDELDVVRGRPGSPGIAIGPARIIHAIAEADALQPGDILVAATTAPPWTILFGTVAAVVTDTGGILSHCAVVAREYGIPAVVGTGVASSTIVDGQIIEVDGSAGVVRVVGV